MMAFSARKLSYVGICSVGLMLVSAPVVQAANQTWNGGSTMDGNWTDPANWVGGAYPGDTTGGTTNTDIATFNALVGPNLWGNSASNPVVIDSGSQSIGGINFTGASDSYFIGGSGGPGGNSLLVTNGGTIQILNTLTSTNAIETINAPIVIEGSSGYTFANNSASGAGAGAGTLILAGGVSSSLGGFLTLSGSNTNANTISGSISDGGGSLGINITGTGSWVISGSNSYTGLTTISSGTLTAASDTALGASNTGTTAGLSFTPASGTATVNFTSTTPSIGLLSSSGAGTSSLVLGNSTAGAATTLSIGGSGNSFTYSGGISDGTGTNAGAVGNIIKVGAGTFTFNGAGTYKGTTAINGGPVILGASGVGSIGTLLSPAGTMTIGIAGSNGSSTAGGNATSGTGGLTTKLTINTGGSVYVSALSQNNEGTSSGVAVAGGILNVSGLLRVASDNVNQIGGLFITNGGAVSAGSVSIGRTNQSVTSVATGGGSTTQGLYVNGGTLTVATTITLTNGTGSNSTPNMRIDSGTVTAGGAIIVTCNNTRYGLLDVDGGSLTTTDTTTGIQIGGNFAATDGELSIRSTGTVTTGKITFGNATQTSGNDALELLGGTLYVGSGGIATGGFSGSTTTAFVDGLSTSTTAAPILGATADWSSSMNISMANNSTSVAPIFQAADSTSAGHNITLSGVLSGTSGLTKTGAGTLTLSGANTYTGITTISNGILSTGATGTLPNGGSNSSIGKSANAAANLILDGGTLQYASTSGTAASTDRLFTLTQNGGGLDASGTSAITFAGNGSGAANSVAFSGSGARTFTLTGSNTGLNTFAPILGDGSGGSTSLKKTGNGSWIVSNNNTFSGGLEVDAGNLTLSGSNSYPGATTLNGGKLIVASTGSLTGNTVITVNSGATFAPNPNAATMTVGSTAATLTLNAGAIFSMQDTGIGTVNINSTGAGSSTVLTFGGTSLSPTSLNFDVGSAGADQLIANNGTVSFTGTRNNISLDSLGATAPSSLTNIPLISVPNGTLVLADFSVNPSQLPLVFGSQAYQPSLTLSGNGHTLLLNLTATSLSFYWKGGAGSSWASTNNFATDQTGATLRASAPTLGSNVFLTANSAASFSQTLDASYNINSLNFTGTGTSAATNSITVASGGAGTNTITLAASSSFQDSSSHTYAAGTGLVVQSGSAAHTISANVILGTSQTWEIDNSAANALNVSGIVSDGGSNFGITKTGTGALKLSNSNMYSGLTAVSAGSVLATNDSALGSSTAATAGLLLNPSSGTASVSFTSASPAIASLASSGAGSSSIALGNTSVGAATNLTVGGNNASTSYGGSISDGTGTNASAVGSLTKTGTGITTLSGTGTYTGLTTLNGGALAITSDAAIHNGSGGINFNGGALQFNNYASSVLPAVAFDNVSTLKLGAGSGVPASLSTVIADSSVLTFVGPGTLQLTGNNTYFGGTNINGGELNAGSLENQGTSGPFGSSGNISFGGGALQYSAVNQFDYSNRIFNSTGAIAIDTNGQAVTFNNTLDTSNTGGLTKLGSGSLTLANSNNYVGLTTVTAGALNVTNDASLGSSTAITSGLLLNPSASVTATANFTSATPAIGSLASAAGASGTGTSQVVLGNATLGAATTLTMGGSNNSTNFGGTISDNVATNSAAVGNIVKLGLGTQTLSGVNTYTGTTAVNGGPLTVNTTGLIGSLVTPGGAITVGAAGTPGGNTIGGSAIAGGSAARLNVSGGSVTVASLALNNEGGTNLSVTTGTLTVTGNMGVNDDGNNNAGLASLNGGTVNANSVTLHRSSITTANNTGSTPLLTGSGSTGLLVNGGTLNIATTLGLDTSNNSASASSANMQILSGSVTVGGTTTITIANGTGRWSILDMDGGTFTSNDTTGAGVQIGGGSTNASSNGELLVRGGTATMNTITFGDATQSSGRDNLELIGGTTYIGSGGIANASSGATITANLGVSSATTAPILGATGNWTSSSAVTLNLANNSTGVAPTFQAADSLNVAHNITINGSVTDNGSGAGLTKIGGGTLTLNGSASYSGATTINQGALIFASPVNISSNMVLNGGNVGTGSQNQTFGQLNVQAASGHLDLGLGSFSTPSNPSGTVHFNGSASLWSAGSVLTVDNWTPGLDHLFVGFDDNSGLDSSELADINFTGFGTGAKFIPGGNGEIEPLITPTESFTLRGDVNNDGHYDVADIVAEQRALANLSAYQANTIAGGNGYGVALNADEMDTALDQNHDGLINNADIQALINNLLADQGSESPVPEPSTFILLGIAVPALWAAKRRRAAA